MNTSQSVLAGPPKLHAAGNNTDSIPVTADHTTTTTCMVSIITDTSNIDLAETPPFASPRSEFDQDDDDADMLLDSDGNPQMGYTENGSLTYLATGNPCLDFFSHIVPNTPADDLIRRLELAWRFDSLLTLKLVFNLRGVRGTGKSDKEGCYTSALWLHKHHPKTLAANLRAFAEFGYFKDLVEVLYRIVEGDDVRKKAKEEWLNRTRMSRRRKILGRGKREKKSKIRIADGDRLLENIEKMAFVDKDKARVLRKEREMAKAKNALDKYNSDLSYRNLHNQVADLFAEMLKFDIEYLNAGEATKISLASKWCPSIDSSFDKATLICESIARRLFPKEMDMAGLDDVHYVYQIRNRLRKEILVPLRKALQLPEVYMSANQWDLLPYNRVASVAMKRYKTIFTKHDKERFDGYLEDVKSGKTRIAAGALLPHEIIAQLDEEDGEKVAELQWARVVDDLLKKGKLSDCMAVCDVSGSMNGLPMEVSVALGLLVSELSGEPWKGKLITFSDNPQLHKVEGDSLKSKTEFIRKMDWGNNTDFQKVFDKILDIAVQAKVSNDGMIKRIFVFSDMEFDEASEKTLYAYTESGDLQVIQGEPWETDYQVIQRKFKDNGYNKVPEIVFWNLRNSFATPVQSNQPGVALLSGFSKNLLTMFFDDYGAVVNPVETMHLAISGEEYKKLVVID